jgi:hypothetical protein
MQPRHTSCVLQLAQQLPVPLLHKGRRCRTHAFASCAGLLLRLVSLRFGLGGCKLLLQLPALRTARATST